MNTEQERAEFEAWAKGHYILQRSAYNDTYIAVPTMRAWEVWQARAAIEADRKRRGEPVAWLYIGPSGNISAAYETVPNLDLYVLAKSEGGKIKPVYEAPQPAEPVRVPSEWQDFPK